MAGNSTFDRYGCPDSDGDSASDQGDEFPNDPTQMGTPTTTATATSLPVNNPTPVRGHQAPPPSTALAVRTATRTAKAALNDPWPSDGAVWSDADGDGYADQSGTTVSDDCPSLAGASTHASARGCEDRDEDGWADDEDAFPDLPTQQVDSDGDGFGDNNAIGAESPDHWPQDASRNVAEASLECELVDPEVDLAVDRSSRSPSRHPQHANPRYGTRHMGRGS